jgi:AcrR family transcriptional regulator
MMSTGATWMVVSEDVNRQAVTTAGRPRDQRIDEDVVRVTLELLVEVGYGRLSIASVAARAGTTKPAIYRRWASKAQLVHEAVFPERDQNFIPDTDDLEADLTSMVRGAVELFGQPTVRAAIPGLLAEFTADPGLHAQLLERFADHIWGPMRARVARAVTRGEMRPDVDGAVVLELVGGAALLALLTRPPTDLDETWVRSTAAILLKGVAA